MKVFLTSALTAIIVAIGSMLVVDQRWQHQVDHAFTSPTSVRLPAHGTTHNLVGKDWYRAVEH